MIGVKCQPYLDGFENQVFIPDAQAKAKACEITLPEY